MRALLTLLALAVLLAACGYKGPLYLPKSKPEAQKPAPKPAPVESKPESE
jgi:predicted small lipoprotein YifL